MKKLLNLYECAIKLDLPPKWLREAAENDVVPSLRLAKRDRRFDPNAVRVAVERLAQQDSAGTAAGGRMKQ